MGGAFISLALSRVMAKWMMGVKVIDPGQARGDAAELVAMVHRLAAAAGLPAMPEVGVYDSPEVNAFATGPTKSRALVAVSTGILSAMDRDELEGVLGHEISHVANGDMVTMTLIQGIVNAFVMFLARVIGFFISQHVQAREPALGQLARRDRPRDTAEPAGHDGRRLLLPLARVPGRRGQRPPGRPREDDLGSGKPPKDLSSP